MGHGKHDLGDKTAFKENWTMFVSPNGAGGFQLTLLRTPFCSGNILTVPRLTVQHSILVSRALLECPVEDFDFCLGPFNS